MTDSFKACNTCGFYHHEKTKDGECHRCRFSTELESRSYIPGECEASLYQADISCDIARISSELCGHSARLWRPSNKVGTAREGMGEFPRSPVSQDQKTTIVPEVLSVGGVLSGCALILLLLLRCGQ